MIIPTHHALSAVSATHANPNILWGWKRDTGPKQRVIAFGGVIVASERKLCLNDWFFFYRSRAEADEITTIHRLLQNDVVEREIGPSRMWNCNRTGLITVEVSGGPSMPEHMPLIQRLLRRRPRHRVPFGQFPIPTTMKLDLSALRPLVAYVGSGLSYESGLPTLASVHEDFGVDRMGSDRFTFGSEDPIPTLLANSVSETFGRFVSFHVRAATAVPSSSHGRIAELYRKGTISRILTDNVDNLFCKLNVPFTRTRGIGIFNDVCSTSFSDDEKYLLAIGIAADRRSVIRQARRAGLQVIVVNPQEDVSPLSQNLSYIRRRDTWYRMSAKEFFNTYAVNGL